MADPQGFLHVAKQDARKRPVEERIHDWREVYAPQSPSERDREVSEQARRCMDCGIPFCHSSSAGCPLGNLIPEWNDLVRRGRWDAATERLHATNNFPEFTGRVCPPPLRGRVRAGVGRHAHHGERDDQAHRTGPSRTPPGRRTSSHPCARRYGRARTSQSSDRVRRGWPRHSSSPGRGTRSRCTSATTGSVGCCGTASPSSSSRRGSSNDAFPRCAWRERISSPRWRSVWTSRVGSAGALRCSGARHRRAARPRQSRRPGPGPRRGALAMEHLVASNHECEGDGATPISARGKHVVIIGGGDTGADCLGTAHRQGALSVTQLDYHPALPEERDATSAPWPAWPMVLRTSRHTPKAASAGTRLRCNGSR